MNFERREVTGLIWGFIQHSLHSITHPGKVFYERKKCTWMQVCCVCSSRGKLTGRLWGCAFIGCVWGEYTKGAEPAFCPGLYGDCLETDRGKQKDRVHHVLTVNLTAHVIKAYHRATETLTTHQISQHLLILNVAGRFGFMSCKKVNWYPQGLETSSALNLHLGCSGAKPRWV